MSHLLNDLKPMKQKLEEPPDILYSKIVRQISNKEA